MFKVVGIVCAFILNFEDMTIAQHKCDYFEGAELHKIASSSCESIAPAISKQAAQNFVSTLPTLKGNTLAYHVHNRTSCLIVSGEGS